MDVTLSRGGTSIDIPVVTDGSGDALISADLGKPEMQFYETGALFPRHIDTWSQLEQFTILGRFFSDTAFADAITLADFMLSHSTGQEMTLDIPLAEFPSNVSVAPSVGGAEAVSIVYNPGRRDWVDIDLGLTRVSDTLASDVGPTASTPTATGTGPIELSDGSTTVELSKGITISRGVGRPNSTVRRTSLDYPNFMDKRKSASDTWDLSFQFTSNVQTQVQNIRSLFNTPLVRDTLELRFNGVYGLGTIDVVPNGAQALRHQRRSGYQGTTNVPAVSLQRVHS